MSSAASDDNTELNTDDQQQDFITLYLDDIQDTYAQLQNYVDACCVPLLNKLDFCDFVNFCNHIYDPAKKSRRSVDLGEADNDGNDDSNDSNE